MNPHERLEKLRRLKELRQKQNGSQAVEPLPNPELKWSDVPGRALSNLPGSLANAAGGVIESITHPIDTAQGLLNLANSGLQKALPDPVNDFMHKISPDTANNRGLADAVGEFYKGRYGSEEGIKNTLVNDPAGALLDASMVTGGAGTLLTKAGLPKAGATLTNLSAKIDPLTTTGKIAKSLVKATGKGASHVLGSATGAGATALQEATKAGATGASKSDDFLTNMRNKDASIDDVVHDAKTALRNIKRQRKANYDAGMDALKDIETRVDMSPIRQAARKAWNMAFHDGIVIDSEAARIGRKIHDKVAEWSKGNVDTRRSVYGVDKLKQSIGDIRKQTKPGTRSRSVADSVYHSISDELSRISPEYKGVMENYARESDRLKELEKTFSLREGNTVDTALRKLQSVTRDNVNTNYGKRHMLAQELEAAGAGNLMAKVAGQSLNSWTPRGLGSLANNLSWPAALMLGRPELLGVLLATSPRLMGESAYYSGKTGRIAKALTDRVPKQAPNAAYQASRINDIARGLAGNN